MSITVERMLILYTTCWWRGCVVRTSVSGRRIFPWPRPIYSWQVNTLWLNCQLT